MRSVATIILPLKLFDVIPFIEAMKAVSDLSVIVFRARHQFKPLTGDGGTAIIFVWPCRPPYDLVNCRIKAVSRHQGLVSRQYFPTGREVVDWPRVKGPRIAGQQLPKLLDVTCCVHLHTLLHVVACC